MLKRIELIDGRIIGNLGESLDGGIVDDARLLLFDFVHDLRPVDPGDIGRNAAVFADFIRGTRKAFALVDLRYEIDVRSVVSSGLHAGIDSICNIAAGSHGVFNGLLNGLLYGQSLLFGFFLAFIGVVIFLEVARVNRAVVVLEVLSNAALVLVELVFCKLADFIGGNALVVFAIGRLLRGYHGVVLPLAHGNPMLLVDRGAVIASEFVGLLKRKGERAVLRIARLGVFGIKQIDLVGHRGVLLVGGARQRAKVHVRFGRKNVGRIQRLVGIVHDHAIGGQVIVLVDDVFGVVAIGSKIEIVRFGIAQRGVVVGNPEVAGMLAFGIQHAPIAWEVGAVEAVARFRAPAVLHQPCAVAFGGVRRGVCEARSEVFLSIVVVPAHNGHSMVGKPVIVGVVGPFAADIAGSLAAIARHGVIGAKRDGNGTARVAAIARVGIQLVFNGVDSFPIHARELAIAVKHARAGQFVAVFEVEKRRVPPRKVVIALRLALLRSDAPVGVHRLAVHAVVAVRGPIAGIGALLVVDDARVVFQGVDFRLGEIFGRRLLGLLRRRARLRGAVGVVGIGQPGHDNVVNGVVGVSFAIVVDASVSIGRIRFKGGAYARCENVHTENLRAARIQAEVGVAQRIVVALALLPRGNQAFRRAAVEVNRIHELKLGKVEARFFIGQPSFGQNARLAGRDDGKAPAGAPGVLRLHGRNHAVVGRVIHFPVLVEDAAARAFRVEQAVPTWEA